MSTSLQASTSNFQPILDRALKEYKRKTGKELITHPLAEEIVGCDSPEAILAVLEGKANELELSQGSDERLTKWLTPTVNVLNALSVTLGGGVGTVFPPTQIIFSGISILLVAARDTAASRDALIELFENIKGFFVRLKTYTELPPTVEMTSVMGKIMAEVLCMLAIATKEMKQGRTSAFISVAELSHTQTRPEAFLKKLVGRKDIEDALMRLDKLERGELWTATAQVLKATGDIKDGVKRIEVIAQQIGTDVGARDWKRVIQDLREWLTPPDPSTNHNIACSTQHERTAAWVFTEDIFQEWESSGSLLWIHGKAGSGKSILCSAIIQHIIALREAESAAVAYFYFDFRDVDKKHRRNLVPSLLVQLSARSEHCLDILSSLFSAHKAGQEQPNERALVKCLEDMLISQTLSRLPTYIVLDALDECPNTYGIPTPRGHILGLVKDLIDLRLPNLRICVTSRPEIDIRSTLEPLASGHLSLHDQPGQKRYISEYISSVVQSDIQMRRWREDDRSLVMEKLSEKADGMFRWVFCQLEMLRHCLAPSLRRQLNELPKSLDETYERVLREIESTNQGHHARRLLRCLVVARRPLRVEDLAEVLAFDLDAAEGEIPRFHPEWRWEDQEQAVLSACSSLVSVVDSDDSRVVQFSHFSVKEYLTSDRLSTASGDVLRYHILPEPAHLTLANACLGVLLGSDNIKNQKEESKGKDRGTDRDKTIPLIGYATEHWASHAQFRNVSSHLKDAMETLFDLNKPYFLAWIRIYNIDSDAHWYSKNNSKPPPLYYAAFCGFYDLSRHLVANHPEQVNLCGGTYNSPLLAALSGKHVRIAELLLEHGAQVHSSENPPLLQAITFSDDARVDAVQFLLRHGAHANVGIRSLWTPLHVTANVGCPEAARMLLEHGADVTIQTNKGWFPMHVLSVSMIGKSEGERAMFARLLVEHRADVNAQDMFGATPLHFTSRHGRLEITQLLLNHGANPHAKNFQGQNPLHELSRGIYRPQCYFYNYHHTGSSGVDPQNLLRVARLLLECGVDVNALDNDHATPLHFASSYGRLEIARLLLDRGAKANVENVHGQTPLHLVSQSEGFSHENSNVARLLLELGLDVNAQDQGKASPLHFACSHGNFETSLVLLGHGAKVNAQNADGQTPLHRVSQSSDGHNDDNPQVAKLMLERGADVNARDKDQATPLHLASYKSKLQTVQVLLDHGAKVNAQNVDGQTPLHLFSQSSNPFGVDDSPVAQLMLDRGADVNARDKGRATPLHIASCHLMLQTVQVLLDHGADADAQNAEGQTPLHRVSQSLHSDAGVDPRIVRLLLDRGVEVNAQDKDQATPLHLASYASSFEIVQVLLDHGAKIDAQNADAQTPLHRASQCLQSRDYSASRVARLLLERGAGVNSRNKDQETSLHLASYNGLEDVVEVLLGHEARTDAKDIRGETPLHHVVLGDHHYQSVTSPRSQENYRRGILFLTQRLLDHGAEVNAQNKDSETPLHLAIRLRFLGMVRILLEHGADVNMKNFEGKSPLQLASGRKRKAMRRLLLEYNAK